MTKPAPVSVQIEPIDDGQLVRLSGDVDYGRAPELRVRLMKLLNSGVPKIVLDLGGVPYMDSSGVAVLVEALQIQRRGEHKLVLCNLTDKVRGIFEISQLHKVFEIVDDVETAARS